MMRPKFEIAGIPPIGLSGIPHNLLSGNRPICKLLSHRRKKNDGSPAFSVNRPLRIRPSSSSQHSNSGSGRRQVNKLLHLDKNSLKV
jgi:hypothetical protein